MALSWAASDRLLCLSEPWILPLDSEVRSLAVVSEGTQRPSARVWRGQAGSQGSVLGLGARGLWGEGVVE